MPQRALKIFPTSVQNPQKIHPKSSQNGFGNRYQKKTKRWCSKKPSEELQLTPTSWGLRVDGWWLRVEVEGWGLRVQPWGLRVEDWGSRIEGRGLMVEGWSWGLRVVCWWNHRLSSQPASQQTSQFTCWPVTLRVECWGLSVEGWGLRVVGNVEMIWLGCISSRELFLS